VIIASSILLALALSTLAHFGADFLSGAAFHEGKPGHLRRVKLQDINMPSVENKTFGEITVGESASTERTLQAGDVRAWAAAFGEAGTLAGPGESQAAAGIITGILTALVGSALPGPGSSIRAASVRIEGALPIATVMTARLVVREKRPDQGIVVLDGQCADPTGQVVATAILEVLAPTMRQRLDIA